MGYHFASTTPNLVFSYKSRLSTKFFECVLKVPFIFVANCFLSKKSPVDNKSSFQYTIIYKWLTPKGQI